MRSSLTDRQLSTLKRRLNQRLQDLQETVRQELVKSDNEQYVHLVGEVHDEGDKSVARLLADLNLSILDQHVSEMRGIQAAFSRIADESYGICPECGDDIPYERLLSHPIALRCRACQSRNEATYAQPTRVFY